MTKKTRGLVTGVLFLAFGLLFFIEGSKYPSTIKGDMGSSFMPQLIAACIIILAVMKIIESLRINNPKAKSNDLASQKEKEDIKGGLMTVALIIVYAVLFKPLGFIVSTFLYLMLQMIVLCDKDKRNWKIITSISVIAPVLIYLFFVYVVERPMPQGFITFI